MIEIEMSHCVGSYVGAVRDQRSLIVSIEVQGQKSTAELRLPDLTLLQHRGPKNSDPEPLCQKVMKRFLRRLQ